MGQHLSTGLGLCWSRQIGNDDCITEMINLSGESRLCWFALSAVKNDVGLSVFFWTSASLLRTNSDVYRLTGYRFGWIHYQRPLLCCSLELPKGCERSCHVQLFSICTAYIQFV